MDDNKSQKSHTDDHNQLPSDEATRNKIDKHLSDKNDTISEEDIKKVNTSTGTENNTEVPGKSAEEKIDDASENDKDDEEPKKEAPTPWEILGE